MRVSVITPSYNQGEFIERTIRSVLGQEGAFDLEYIVLDGGSTDNTVDILRSFGSRVTWQSGPDGGQSAAINAGFKMATGAVVSWLNSDDTYVPGALAAVTDEYRREPFEWCYGNCRNVDEQDHEIRHTITRYKAWQARHYSYRHLLRRNFIAQPATFFTKQAYEAIGEIDTSLSLAMDYDYFLRLGAKYEPRYLDRHIANFRWHGGSKCGQTYGPMAREAYELAKKHAPPGSRWDLFLHYLHMNLLKVVYRFL